MTTRANRSRAPQPPELTALPLVHAGDEVARWLNHYWAKLSLPGDEAQRLAVTNDRSEFHRWTGRRLNSLALGCYCYLPGPGDVAHQGATGSATRIAPPTTTTAITTAIANAPARVQPALPGFDAASGALSGGYTLSTTATGTGTGTGIGTDTASLRSRNDYRHLIFVEPALLPLSVEVTVAHELIHLADRVKGTPRRHRCHGYDSISLDEAAITGRDPELLRAQLREETERREQALRAARPYRYLYHCPHCHKEYPRVRRYARPVSCGRCDRQFNPAFLLQLQSTPQKSATDVTTPHG